MADPARSVVESREARGIEHPKGHASTCTLNSRGNSTSALCTVRYKRTGPFGVSDFRRPACASLLRTARALRSGRARIVPLDEVTVVAVHHAHEIGQARRARRMQARTQFRGRANELSDDVGQCRRIGVDPTGLDAGCRFVSHARQRDRLVPQETCRCCSLSSHCNSFPFQDCCAYFADLCADLGARRHRGPCAFSRSAATVKACAEGALGLTDAPVPTPAPSKSLSRAAG
jgi:hypothetical protein